MVSATENVSKDANVNNGNELTSNQASTDVDLLSDSAATGTFTDLAEEISNADNNIVTLTKDYKYDSSKDSSYAKGISLSKITINGNNHIIDGSSLARIFTLRSANATLNDIKFVNGHSARNSNGGAILVESGTLTVNNCTFEKNYANQHGGAIGVSSLYSSYPVNVYNSRFISNTAEFNGGAIYARDLVVDNSIFDSNRILARYSKTSKTIDDKALGGAILASYSKISGSTFKNNTVYNPGEYQIDEGGGAIASIHRITVDNSIFENNVGFKGGAIFGIAPYDSDLVPTNYVKVTNSKFISNIGYSAGAICSNYNLTVDNSVFDKNNAIGYGGGAINTGFKSNNNIFTNSNFTNNQAVNYGGALSISHSKIDNCLFENNLARHGGAIFSLSFDISNSVLKDNVATEGKNIIVIDGYTKDDKTVIPESDVVVYNQNEIADFSKDILDGHPRDTHYIPSGNFAGYQLYCVEEHLFRPENTEGVLIEDLSYIVNSIGRDNVSDYLKVLFYLLDAYPDDYKDYTESSIQTSIWIFTDGNYLTSRDKLVRNVINFYNNRYSEMNLTDSTYVLPNGEKMEYDMKLFLTPADRQNMVLFKSAPFTERYNETVLKETINETVLVGEGVKFRITVTNVGNMILSDVFVNDTQYSKGLVYKTWYNENRNWTYKNNGVWLLDGILRPKQNASFIIEFNTTETGVLTNNVTSGYMNITLANSTNDTTVLANPEMSVRKISNNLNAKVGDTVSFTIIVENTGKYDITGLYILDTQYTEGITYDYYVDPYNLWKYKGNGRWDYKGVLKVGESCGITLFFIAKSTGLKENTVIAGNNQTNKTVNSTNITNITKTVKHKNDTDIPDNDTDVPKHILRKHDKYATGNPLFALILVLISLGVVTFKHKK